MAKRKRMIDALREDNPDLYEENQQAARSVDGIKHFVHVSGRFPLTSYGRLNTYSLFAESGRMLVAPSGRVGQIVPTGIATDSFNQYFFSDLVETGSLSALYDFENAQPLFEAVHRSSKFCLLTLTGRDTRSPEAEFAFFLHDPSELDQANKRFSLTPDEITLLNPNTGTCPVFRSRRDAEVTLSIYHRVPVLIKEGDPNGNPWGVKFQLMFMMNIDSDKFHTRQDLEADGWALEGNVFARGKERMLPLYQGAMASFFDHRAADMVRSATAGKRQNQPSYLTSTVHSDPNRTAIPIYWVPATLVDESLPTWLTAFARITSPSNERTMVPFAVPRTGVGDSAFLINSVAAPQGRACLLAALSSFALDFTARQKVGGTNLNYFYVKQFPTPLPAAFLNKCPWDHSASTSYWISTRIEELCYTAYDMAPLARDLGDSEPPFRWDEERRALLRAELDAASFHLYGIKRDDVDYIMDTFPIVKRKDEAAYGTYRTKELILEIYDAMTTAIRTGIPYKTILDPAPGHGPRHTGHSAQTTPSVQNTHGRSPEGW
jgi:hypothetical protein